MFILFGTNHFPNTLNFVVYHTPLPTSPTSGGDDREMVKRQKPRLTGRGLTTGEDNNIFYSVPSLFPNAIARSAG